MSLAENAESFAKYNTRSDDTGSDEPNAVCEGWTSNYIIVEKILGELHWRDLQRSAATCRLWREAARALRRKNLRCYDYAIVKSGHRAVLKVSRSPVLAPPMVTFSFAPNLILFPCQHLIPSPCQENCGKDHSAVEALEKSLLSEETCQLSVYGVDTIYMPIPTSQTHPFTLKKAIPYLTGLYIPKIPNVNCQIIEYNGLQTAQINVYNSIDNICATDVIKGIIVFAEERILLESGENLEFLSYFRKKQPDVPFAMGGCVVETAYTHTNPPTNAESNETMVSLAVLSAPRRPAPEPRRTPFEMFSLVVPRNCYTKSSIKQEIQKFASRVPEMQYSACLKLTCVGRDKVNQMECNLFREAFPRTTIVGCLGNGEIGCEHPPRADPAPSPPKKPALRDHNSYMYTYTTVFVYFCWGRLIRDPTAVNAT